MNIQEDPIHAVELELPSPPVPVANYVPVRQVGNLVFTSGQTPTRDGILTVSGKLGRELTVEEGQQASATAVLGLPVGPAPAPGFAGQDRLGGQPDRLRCLRRRVR